MELRHLRYFVAVAEELNVSRAARRLHMAQPPLSLQIRQLESGLNVELFHRVRRRLLLSPAGQTMLIEARRLLANADQLTERVRAAACGQSSKLSIGFVGTAMYDVLPAAVNHFRKRFPAVELGMLEISSAKQVQALHRERIDLGLLRPPVEDDAIEAEEIVRETLMVALPKGHPLGDKVGLTLQDLANESFLFCRQEVEPSLYNCYMRLTREAGFKPRIVQEMDHLQTQLGLVAIGMGICLVPSAVAYQHRRGVICRKIHGPEIKLPKSAVWLRGRCSPQVQGFVAALRHAATDLRAASPTPTRKITARRKILPPSPEKQIGHSGAN